MKKRNKIILFSVIIFFLLVIMATILIGILVDWNTAKLPWDFLSNEILGMNWLNVLIGKIFHSLFGEFSKDSRQFILISAIQFFIYDFIKITVLLCILIFVISYIQSYFPPERTKKILEKFHGIWANIIGALLGTVTPFCSCSSIPIFIGFTRAGISSGVTFSFLISSPLVDLGSLMLLVSFFGWEIAICYVLIGLVLAVLGGTIIEKTGLGKHVEEFVLNGESNDIEVVELTFKERLIYAKDQAIQTYKKVFLYILIGVGIGCIIHNVIPQEWIETILGKNNWYGVILATTLGTPMYADIFGTLPVAEALYNKGAGLGTVLSFMMSVTALSLPSLIMLRKAIKLKLLIWFIVIVVLGIIVVGYFFNFFEYLFI